MESMQIDKICRACLREDDKMIDMHEKDVYQKFLLFANLTVDSIPDVPLNLCQSCEQKLKNSLNFKEECQKSHEILLNYVKNTREVASKPTASATVSNTRNPLRLEQFSHDQVSEVIKDVVESVNKEVNCIRCNYVGCNSRTLSVHVSQLHKDLKPRWCGSCNAEFDNLIDHVATNHSDNYTCKFCSKKFKKISCLIEHLPGHSDVKSFRCLFCKKSFNRQSYLNVHLRNHMKEKPFKCSSCNQSFTRLHLMQYHLKMHESEGNADKQLDALDSIKHKQAHMRTYYNKKLKTHSHLARHEPTHNHLADHNKTHSDLRLDQSSLSLTHIAENSRPDRRCLMCNKIFFTDAKLTSHIKTHTVSFLDI